MILLKYKQRVSKPNYIIVERFGTKTFVSQSGFEDYDQEEEVADNKVEKRVKELKSFSNVKYHSFIW